MRRLISNKEDISVLVRKDANLWRLKNVLNKIPIYECDILDRQLKDVVKKINPDYIFHFASYGVFSSQNDINKIIDINIKGTINLMQAAKEIDCKLLVNAGSATEYGIKDIPLKEDQIILPVFNDYAVAKAATTLFLQKEAVRYNLPFITLRIFTPYGPYEDKNRLIPYIICNALKNDPIKLTNPANVRDFIFVEDLIDAYLRAIHSQVRPGEIINIGSGQQHSIQEVVDTTLSIVSSNSEIVWRSAEIKTKEIEPKMWIADISKARKILNWKPSYTLKMGISQTVDFIKKNKTSYDLS